MENNTQQPDYLNPESDKYYKGYRYEKFEPTGNEIWVDENGTIRKKIVYYDNGNKYYEGYYNENGDRHNEDGYAFQSWDIKGKLKKQVYFLNGVRLSEQEWKGKTGKNTNSKNLVYFTELYWDKYNERMKINTRIVNEIYPSKDLLDKDLKKILSLKNEMIEICKFIGFTPENNKEI